MVYGICRQLPIRNIMSTLARMKNKGLRLAHHNTPARVGTAAASHARRAVLFEVCCSFRRPLPGTRIFLVLCHAARTLPGCDHEKRQASCAPNMQAFTWP